MCLGNVLKIVVRVTGGWIAEYGEEMGSQRVIV